jgi:dTDP-glucose 4,6-dehydratase
MLNPSNPYAATKAAADMMITAWGRTHLVPYLIVRPTNNYGIGQYVEKLSPKSIKYLMLGRKIPLHAQGTPRRTWLHVEDTVEAVLNIINNHIKTKETNQIYNISGNFEEQNIVVVKRIIDMIHPDVINYENYIDFGFERPGQDVRYALNDERLKNIGWLPQANFYSELALIVEFHKNTFVW